MPLQPQIGKRFDLANGFLHVTFAKSRLPASCGVAQAFDGPGLADGEKTHFRRITTRFDGSTRNARRKDLKAGRYA